MLPGPLSNHPERKRQAMSETVIDRLREMFGIEATDPEAVFAAVEAYDRRNLRIMHAQDAELARLRADPFADVLILLRDLSGDVLALLHELEDRERLAFGQPLPETSDVIQRFAAAVALPEETPQ